VTLEKRGKEERRMRATEEEKKRMSKGIKVKDAMKLFNLMQKIIRELPQKDRDMIAKVSTQHNRMDIFSDLSNYTKEGQEIILKYSDDLARFKQ
jgi:Mg/Co/Ni transporter MgtE